MNIKDLKGNYKVVSGAAPVQPKVDSRDFLEKAADTATSIFPGTKEIGESLGTIAAAGGEAIKGNIKGAKEVLDTQVSVPRLIGAYTSAGAQVAGTAGAGVGGGLLKSALASAGIGAAISGGATAAKGGDAGEIVQSSLIGGATGGAVSVAGAGLSAIGSNIQKLPQRLVRSSLGQTKQELLAGKDLSKYIIENKKIGTADKLINDAQKNIDQLDELINKNLRSMPVTSAKVETKSVVESVAKKINEAGGEIGIDEVQDILNNLAPQARGLLKKPEMDVLTANKLRIALDKTTGDKGFIASQLPFNKEVLREFSNALREQVKSKAPEGTRAAFNTYSKEITLRDTLLRKVAGSDRNQIIGLGDLISGGLGSVLGGAPGAIGGAAAKRALTSTPFLTGSAVVIDRLDSKLSPILESLAPATQTAIITAIASALSENAED